MPIYRGNSLIDELYRGSSVIDEVYRGSTLVYSRLKLIDLGLNTSWNIKNFSSNWANLTVDNFFIGASNTATLTGDESGDVVVYRTSGLTKTYSNGTLNMYITLTDGSASATSKVHAYLVENVNKLVSLGSGTSFDVSDRSDYSSLVDGNFLIKSLTGNDTGDGIRTPRNYSMSSGIERNYNSSTGIFTASLHGHFEDNLSRTRDQYISVNAYLFPKTL